MLGMAAKKRRRGDAPKVAQVPFRVDDPRLVEALDRYADSTRRSRNMAIIVLLEQALTVAGFWPPEEGDE
jgi:hypothetical protein